MHPYKLVQTNCVPPSSKNQRIHFANCIKLISSHPHYHRHVYWPDESYVYLTQALNKQNYRKWTEKESFNDHRQELQLHVKKKSLSLPFIIIVRYGFHSLKMKMYLSHLDAITDEYDFLHQDHEPMRQPLPSS